MPLLRLGASALCLLTLGACSSAFTPIQGSAPQPVAPDGEADAEARAELQPAWRADRVLVSVRDPDQAAALAEDHGLLLRARPTADGLLSLGLPQGRSVEAVLPDLMADVRVADARPMGMIQGALSSGARRPGLPGSCDRDGRLASLQWHLDAAGVPRRSATQDLSGVVVAVLDTGVAYEDHIGANGQIHAAAPSLAGVDFVAPLDLVEEDGHPNDDNGHGTHITSLIASSGQYCGVAPGVSIMPIKVLDEDNQGDELDLIRALRHARENGADIVNMSLSFGPGYLPSPELRAELAEAYEASMVMVASAGNTGADSLTWPAASAHVLAVSAGSPDGSGPNGAAPLVAAAYSSRSGGMSLMAPGGDLSADRDGDGLLDGIVAESIAPGAPETVGPWMMAGTSQAAALVTGAAVWLVAAGADDYGVAAALMGSATPLSGGSAIEAGMGTGALNVEGARQLWASEGPKVGKRFLSLVPWLAPTAAGQVQVRALVTGVDMRGEPVEDGAVVHATLRGSAVERLSCVMEDGRCTLVGSPLPPVDPSGASLALGWSVYVDAVERVGALTPPASSLHVGPELDAVVAAMESSDELEGEALAFYWSPGLDPDVGVVAESWAILDLEGGSCVNPHAAVVNPAFMQEWGGTTEALLRLDAKASGAESDGKLHIDLWTLGGSGLATSPMGFFDLRLAVVDGAVLDGGRSRGIGSLGGLSGGTATLATLDGGRLAGDFHPAWTRAALAEGGWQAGGGYGAAELLVEQSRTEVAGPARTGTGAQDRVALAP